MGLTAHRPFSTYPLQLDDGYRYWSVAMNIRVYKQQALVIRNQSRAMSQSGDRRASRAKALYSALENGAWHKLVDHGRGKLFLHVQGSNQDVHCCSISEHESACTCKDAEKGNLCKHQILLGALVISKCAGKWKGNVFHYWRIEKGRKAYEVCQINQDGETFTFGYVEKFEHGWQVKDREGQAVDVVPFRSQAPNLLLGHYHQ